MSAADSRPGSALARFQALAAALLLCLTVLAQPASGSTAESEVRAALTAWQRDFNDRRADRICDLFSRELRYDYRGFPERGFDDICELLKRSLSDPARSYSYALRIEEILISGDLAVVRLVWTLDIVPADGSPRIQSTEPGMDVFRREADGRWRIIRYIAYEE